MSIEPCRTSSSDVITLVDGDVALVLSRAYGETSIATDSNVRARRLEKWPVPLPNSSTVDPRDTSRRATRA